jgi:hypothetical protein
MEQTALDIASPCERPNNLPKKDGQAGIATFPMATTTGPYVATVKPPGLGNSREMSNVKCGK